MENAVKALEIAAGVLLGVILMAMVAYFFTRISSWPENEEDIMSAEQLAAFNEEYVVYNKSKMYGVDVLSCMNKVISNNEKYAEGGAFLGGNASLGDYKQRENYWINIKIHLETELTETLTTYHYKNNQEVLNTEVKSANLFINSSGLEKLKKAVKQVGNYTSLSESTQIISQVMTTGNNTGDLASVECFSSSDNYKEIIDGKEYINLVYEKSDGNISDMNQDIVNLLDSIQTLSGDSGSTGLTFVVTNKDSSSYDKWSKIIWQTVLYDLKSRKFKCTSLTYNTTTGRVNEIVFEEIGS